MAACDLEDLDQGPERGGPTGRIVVGLNIQIRLASRRAATQSLTAPPRLALLLTFSPTSLSLLCSEEGKDGHTEASSSKLSKSSDTLALPNFNVNSLCPILKVFLKPMRSGIHHRDPPIDLSHNTQTGTRD